MENGPLNGMTGHYVEGVRSCTWTEMSNIDVPRSTKTLAIVDDADTSWEKRLPRVRDDPHEPAASTELIISPDCDLIKSGHAMGKGAAPAVRGGHSDHEQFII